MAEQSLVPVERIERAILVLRGHRVMLDEALAGLYDVEVKALNQAVKRNIDRFPADFMFQLTPEEARLLRSQTVTLEGGRGQHRKYPPYAFTEHGAIMAASVLNSDRWLRDESLEDSANLPNPDILAAEIIEDLQAALEELVAIQSELSQGAE